MPAVDKAKLDSLANVTTSSDGFMIASDKVKLDGIATAATANATNAQLRDRSTHTGTQTASTISDLQTVVELFTLGTFTGNKIADNATVKSALQALETGLEAQQVTGRYIGSATTLATLPIISAATGSALNGDWATLTADDGVNLKGVYLYNGSVYSFAFALASNVGVMQGSTSSVAGVAGLVPASPVGQQDRVLSAGGTWVEMLAGKYKGTYSSTDAYAIGDMVSTTNGQLYVSNTSRVSGTWTPQPLIGDSGANTWTPIRGKDRGLFNSSLTYAVGDVAYDDTITLGSNIGWYRATSTHTGGNAPSQSGWSSLSIAVASNGVPTGTIINGLWGLASFGSLAIPVGYWPLDGTVINSVGSALHGITTPDTRGQVLANAKASGGAQGTTAGAETVTVARANLPNVAVNPTGTFTPVGTVSVANTTVDDTYPTQSTFLYDGTGSSTSTGRSGLQANNARVHSHTATFTGTNSAVNTTFNLNGAVTQTAIDLRQATYYVTQLVKL
jgi:hypothetical protein